ncbi:SET domain-containing protein [Candidatus Bathyarchaeota archaeon]|nr:SET domain-containing protein [Candidatus Bathyarchaeota archaeon]
MENLTVKESKISGKGFFSSKSFRKGEVILEMDDSHVVTDPSTLTKEQHEFELDYLADGKIVVMQAPERYINHSCSPNSYVKTVNGVRMVFAMRDIERGEEIVWETIRLMGITKGLSSVAVEARTAGSFIKAISLNFRRHFRRNIFHILTIGS